MVLTNHAGITDFLLESYWGKRFWHLLSGEAGVSFFFLISGFLITHLLIREKEKKGRINYKNFLIRRFLRLMPPLWGFYLFWGLLVLLGALKGNSVAFLFSFFYAYNFLPQKFNIIELTHTWSLAVEEQFYFLWPLVFQRFRSMGYGSLLLGLSLLCMLSAIFIMNISFPLNGEDIFLRNAFRPMRWFIPAIFPILIGIFIALYSKRVLTKTQFWTLALLGVIPVFILPEKWLFMVYFTLPFFFGSILWKVVHDPDSRWVKLLEFPVLEWVGRWSYSLYIWQGLFLTTGVGSSLYFQVFPLNLLLTFIFAILSYYWIEQPLQKWREKFRE